MEFPNRPFNDMSEFLSAPPQLPLPVIPLEPRRQRRNRHHGRRHHRKHKKDQKIQHIQHQDVINRLDKIRNILGLLVREVVEEKAKDNLSISSPLARPAAPVPNNTNRNSPALHNKKTQVIYYDGIEPVVIGSSWESRHPFDIYSPSVGGITPDKLEEYSMSGALPLTDDIIEDLVSNFYWLQQDISEAVHGLCELRNTVNSAPVEAVRDVVYQLVDKLGEDLNNGLAHLQFISNRQKQEGLYDYLCSRSAFMLSSPAWQRTTRAQVEEAIRRSATRLHTFGSSEERLPGAIPTSLPPSKPCMTVPVYSNAMPPITSYKMPKAEGPTSGCSDASDPTPNFGGSSHVSTDTDWDIVDDLRSSRNSQRSRLSL